MTKSNTYIKSPLNYVGGKFKLLPSILPLIPTDLNVFYDLFGGGFNVGINVDAERIVYNDINVPVVRLIKHLYEHDTDSMLYMIDDLIELFKLSKENSDGFLRLRNYYNNGNKDPITFYTLICYAFNYQIRFNKQGEYNMPFGKKQK